MWKITMSLLTAFGLFSVTAMLVCYALEKKSPWFILGFAGACALAGLSHAEVLYEELNPSSPAFELQS